MPEEPKVRKLGERYWEPQPGKVQRIRWVSDKPMPPGVSLPGVGFVDFPAAEFETAWASLIVDAVAGFKLVKSAPKAKADTKPKTGEGE